MEQRSRGTRSSEGPPTPRYAAETALKLEARWEAEQQPETLKCIKTSKEREETAKWKPGKEKPGAENAFAGYGKEG